jgi:hypothetical protein
MLKVQGLALTAMLGKSIELDYNPLVVFIPKDDDTFRNSSHNCEFVVDTPSGTWLFNKSLDPVSADKILEEQYKGTFS